MSHARKGPAQDAAGRRRDYLRKKAMATIPAVVAGALSVLLVSFLLKLALQRGTMSDSQFAAFLLFLVLTVPCSIVIVFCEKKRLSIPYVPPVAEQVAALPADEVLVRASDEPPATPEELLRAAREGTVTVAEDLLRSNEGC